MSPAQLKTRICRIFGGSNTGPLAQQAVQLDIEFAKPYRVPSRIGGMWLLCLDGTAWLTREGCHADLILVPGQAVHVPATDGALVVGMPRCTLRLATLRELLCGPQGQPQATRCCRCA